MAAPRHQRTSESDAVQDEASEESGAQRFTSFIEMLRAGENPLRTAVAHVPTLEEAFFTLCAALSGRLDDNLTAWDHAQEIQAWMVNAGDDPGGKAQQHLAWQHAVMLLEQVLGQSLALR